MNKLLIILVLFSILIVSCEDPKPVKKENPVEELGKMFRKVKDDFKKGYSGSDTLADTTKKASN